MYKSNQKRSVKITTIVAFILTLVLMIPVASYFALADNQSIVPEYTYHDYYFCCEHHMVLCTHAYVYTCCNHYHICNKQYMRIVTVFSNTGIIYEAEALFIPFAPPSVCPGDSGAGAGCARGIHFLD